MSLKEAKDMDVLVGVWGGKKFHSPRWSCEVKVAEMARELCKVFVEGKDRRG